MVGAATAVGRGAGPPPGSALPHGAVA